MSEVEGAVHRLRAMGVLQVAGKYMLLGGIFAVIGGGLMLLPGDKGAFVPGLVFFVPGVLALASYFYFYLSSPKRVEVGDDGITWDAGGRTRTKAWEDVRKVYRKDIYVIQGNAKPSDWNRTSELRLVFGSGPDARFSHVLSDYDRLIEGVLERTREPLLTQARADLEEGGVKFGPLTLTPTGIEGKGFSDAFESMKRLTVSNGGLTWYTKSGFQRGYPLHEIPNAHVLLALLAEGQG